MIDFDELTPEQLRNRAERIRDIAQRAECLSVFNYEMNKAKELDKLADTLEKQNNDAKN